MDQTPPIRVLIVEDEPAHAMAVRLSIEREMAGVSVEMVSTIAGLREVVRARLPHIVLMDLNLPDGRAIDVLTEQGAEEAFPILVMTSYGNEATAVEAMRAGALDYIVKSAESFRDIPRALGQALREWEAVQARRRAEKALQDSEERFRSLFEAAPLGYQSLDSEGCLLEVNPAWLQILGHTREEAIGRWFGDFLAATSREKFRESFPRFKAAGEIHGITFEMLRRDGSTVLVEFDGRIGVDDQGRFKQTHCVLRNVTEREQMLAALYESQRRFEILTQASPVGVFRTDPTGGTTFVNPKWCEIAGISADEAMGDGWLRAVHPDDRARIERGWQGGATGERAAVAEYRFLRPDGSLAWVLGQVVEEAETAGRITGYVGTVTDITARKIAEEAIEQGRAELQAVYDFAPVVMCVVDEARRVLFANRAFEELSGRTGVAPQEERACGILGCIHARDDVRGCGYGPHCATCSLRLAIADSFATGQGHRGVEYRTTLTSSGTDRDVTLLASTARLPGGPVRRLLLCLEDITERRLAQEASERAARRLRETQRIEAIGRLAGGVAHDFNNLLQAMVATVQSLRLRSTDPQVVRTAQELEKHVKRGASLTKQLLLFSRRQEPRIEPLDLNELVREAATMLRRLIPENIRFATEFAPGELTVDGDRSQLDQVLMNLVVNARDAMVDGGQLVVRTGAPRQGQVSIEVVDTGTGIAAEIRERLFEPFFSTKAVGLGTGLGLAVVHGIVGQHGGNIEVESELGLGSTFRVVLPLRATRPAAVHPADEIGALVPGRGERVLVVEDEEGARSGLQEILELLGYKPTVVASAEEALLLPDEPPFDVVLSDLMLPGMSGGRLATSLLARCPALKVILMSGYLEDERVRHEVPSAARFLQKPFDLEALGREIRAALDSPES